MHSKRMKAISPPASSAARATVFRHVDGGEPLIPGLPNHISHLCLSHLPPSLLFQVSSAWRRLLYSPLFPPFLSLYALLSPSSAAAPTPIQLMCYDPLAREWLPVPPPPDPPLRILLRHPSFISRSLPVQSLSVAGRLVLLAATDDRLVLLAATDDRLLPALPLPLIFSPESGDWFHGPALPASRRWCAAGTLEGSVYVASGIGSHYKSDVARSFDKWNAGSGERWEPLGRLKDGRLSREAIDAVGCRGRLWMVNVKGDAAKQGAVYDAGGSGAWGEMPEAMIGGWRGPAAAMAEEDIYAVDESNGSLRKWEWQQLRWSEVVESPLLRGAQQIAAAAGKVCAVVDGGSGIVVVDVAADPAKVWVVDTPPGLEAVAVHVLPRMPRK